METQFPSVKDAGKYKTKIPKYLQDDPPKNCSTCNSWGKNQIQDQNRRICMNIKANARVFTGMLSMETAPDFACNFHN